MLKKIAGYFANSNLKNYLDARKSKADYNGYRFLITAATGTPDVIFFNLNPQCAIEGEAKERLLLDDGKNYWFDEEWVKVNGRNEKLGMNFRKLFGLLEKNGKNNVLGAYFYPERTHDEKSLDSTSKRYSEELWNKLLRTGKLLNPKLIVCHGNSVFNAVLDMYGLSRCEKKSFSVWSGLVGLKYVKKAGCPVIASVPQLSRFGVFTRVEDEKAVQDWLQEIL